MPKISFTVPLGGKTSAKTRVSLTEAIKMPDVGASPKGSTYRKSLLQCPFEHAVLYELGLRPESPTEALTIGLVFHYALQRYYEAIHTYQQLFKADWTVKHPETPRGYLGQNDFFWGNEPEAAKIAWQSIADLQYADGYADTWETLSRTLNAYFDHYTLRDRWEIIAVEETVEYYGLSAGLFDHTARLDLVVHDVSDGRIYIVEHKTAKWVSQDLVDFYDLDLQILGQVWLAAKCVDWQALGFGMFGGVKINIASKQKTPILIRHDVLPSTQHLQAFELTMVQWEGLRGVYAQFGWPRALGQCAGAPRGYSKCQCYELCRQHPLESIESLKRWRDPPSGFVVAGKNAPTVEDHNV